MTREEVIERLKLILETDIMTLNGFNIPHEPLEKEIEALKIAIKALEQEPILGKIRAEIEKEAFTDINNSKFIFVNHVNQIFDKYKAESEKSMNTERNCQSCKYYKDGYCENLEVRPWYPQKGCDDFSEQEELKTGHWIRVGKDKLICSKCDVIHFIAQYPHGKIAWCPNCGAKMESEEI